MMKQRKEISIQCDLWLFVDNFRTYLLLSHVYDFYFFRPPYESSIWKSKSQSAFINETNQFKSNAVQRSLTQSNMAIAELQAKLQQSGESEWRKRHLRISNTSEELRNIYNVI